MKQEAAAAHLQSPRGSVTDVQSHDRGWLQYQGDTITPLYPTMRAVGRDLAYLGAEEIQQAVISAQIDTLDRLHIAS